MDDLQFLKDEISSAKFNKRIFYAKNALRYTEIMSIDFFVDNYIPYITNYLCNEENVEEVLTEYSNTLTFFLKFLGKEENLQNYKNKKEKSDKIEENKINYINSINLILKCFFEKILLNEDEILKETTINNLKDLLLELDEFPLLKKEFENKLNSFKILNNEINEKNNINEENEINAVLFSLLYPFIKDEEQKILKFCNKFKTDISNNANRKKKRLLIQNIINIIPFIKKSLDHINETQEQNIEKNEYNISIIKYNIYILKEILSSMGTIMDDTNLIIQVGMNYLCEIILVYTIENIADIILFYDEYNKYLSNQEIDLILINFLSKLENSINNETNLKVNLTWRVKVAYIENICKLKKFISNHNQKYYIEFFSPYCQNLLKGSKNEIDLKISILKNVEIFIPTIDQFILIFKDMVALERNQYILSSLGMALNKILNNKELYEFFETNNNNNEKLHFILNSIFQLIDNLLNNDNFEINYSLLSSFEFSFFNYISNDKEKIMFLNQTIKLIIFVFQKINEWRIRYNLYEEFRIFFFEKNNILNIFAFYQKAKTYPDLREIIFQLISNIRILIHLFFLDKANMVRMSSLEMINTIIIFQNESKIDKSIYLIRIKEELMKYQLSIFCKNSIFDEYNINNLNLLDMSKSYCMKLFFLESVKKFINLYSNSEKNIIKEILQLIKNDSKYAKENIANNKINCDIEYITKILEDDKN